MISFLERNFTYLVTMTSIIYCILGLVLIFFKSPDRKSVGRERVC